MHTSSFWYTAQPAEPCIPFFSSWRHARCQSWGVPERKPWAGLQGKTGQQSLFTNLLQFLGSIARVFTSVKEGAGMPMVRGFLMGSCVNGTVTSQILFYGRDGRKGAAVVPAEELKKDR